MLFRILNSKGDESFEFENLGIAHSNFLRCLKEGKTAFKVTPSKSGSSEVDSELIRDFDPTAQEIWFTGQLSGG